MKKSIQLKSQKASHQSIMNLMSNTNIKQHLLEFSQGWEDYIGDCLRVVDNTNRYYVKKRS